MIDIEKLETLAKAATSGRPGDRIPFAIHAMDPAAILELCAEVRRLREDADLFSLLISTCDALDANSFDESNQPGTLRIVCKHKTETYPELQAKIAEFIKGYKARVDAAKEKP